MFAQLTALTLSGLSAAIFIPAATATPIVQLSTAPTQAEPMICPTNAKGQKLIVRCGECTDWKGEGGWTVKDGQGKPFCNPCNKFSAPFNSLASRPFSLSHHASGRVQPWQPKLYNPPISILSAYEPPSGIGGPKRTGGSGGRYIG